MNVQDNPNSWTVEKFAIGQPVPRSEDPKLVQGQGRYTDDVTLPKQAYAVILRSRYAHGTIGKIDITAAKAMPGVLAIYTGADFSDGTYGVLKTVMPLKGRDGNPMKVPTRYALATDKVRFVGDPIACVVAETVYQGKDAAEAIEVEIDPLPSVTTPREAVKQQAPQLYADVPGNVAVDWHFGDSAKVDEAFKSAAHVVKMPLRQYPRRGQCHGAARVSRELRQGERSLHGLHWRPERVRAEDGDRRGTQSHARQGARAARQCRRLVRHEGAGIPRIRLRAACNARARPPGEVDRRALDAHSCPTRTAAITIRQSSLRSTRMATSWRCALTGYGNSGAFVSMMGTMQPTITTMKNMIGVYNTPLIEQSTKLRVHQHDAGRSAYRGAGRPEGNYYMERLIDQAAREMGIDRIETPPAQSHQTEGNSLQDAAATTSMTAATSQPCSSARSSSPTTRALPSASARARSAASCAASASAASWK